LIHNATLHYLFSLVLVLHPDRIPSSSLPWTLNSTFQTSLTRLSVGKHRFQNTNGSTWSKIKFRRNALGVYKFFRVRPVRYREEFLGLNRSITLLVLARVQYWKNLILVHFSYTFFLSTHSGYNSKKFKGFSFFHFCFHFIIQHFSSVLPKFLRFSEKVHRNREVQEPYQRSVIQLQLDFNRSDCCVKKEILFDTLGQHYFVNPGFDPRRMARPRVTDKTIINGYRPPITGGVELDRAVNFQRFSFSIGVNVT